MNVEPHYHKLGRHVSHIWGNCRGHEIQSALDKLSLHDHGVPCQVSM